MLQERVEQTVKEIGLNELIPPILYKCPIGLRFEIGDPLTTVYDNRKLTPKYVGDAFRRVSELYEHLHCNFDILVWDIYPLNVDCVETKIAKFAKLAQLTLPQEQVHTRDTHSEDMIEKMSCYWNLNLQHLNISALFKEILTADLGGFTELCSSVYLFDTKEDLIFFLYDDRGLDIVSKEKKTIENLYTKYNSWLLNYDRTRIDKVFAN